MPCHSGKLFWGKRFSHGLTEKNRNSLRGREVERPMLQLEREWWSVSFMSFIHGQTSISSWCIPLVVVEIRVMNYHKYGEWRSTGEREKSNYTRVGGRPRMCPLMPQLDLKNDTRFPRDLICRSADIRFRRFTKPSQERINTSTGQSEWMRVTLFSSCKTERLH